MRFHPTARIGKAGERRLETFIEEQLGFIYRPVGTSDIGIDGEIETLAPGGRSTGGFLKVQVKTVERAPLGPRFRVALDERHLDYFASLTVPPILVLVNLADDRIWWQPILQKGDYAGPRGGYGIPIDLHRDRMTGHSTTALRLVAERSNALIVRSLIEAVEQSLSEMDESEASGRFDLWDVEHWADLLRSYQKTVTDIACLLKYERRASADIKAIQRAFRDVVSRIDKRREWFSDWDCGDLLRNVD
ncbi:DUF4365 domain-containing protein [Polymorphobacter megasporae]|uniref:DUF4365 domain-containing protein n=1 Tax=Glacieibacterium megasporae TaxID=2835787 RepID=UPI001C1E077E|nr:DUF4365 domain-containing protein [Polymorphobacter megasporae]UAJ12612.1 DUF4365 domain-containing protein [Polymorphobacter megasporae]